MSISSTFEIPIEKFLLFRLPKSHSFPLIHSQSLILHTCNGFTTVSRLCWFKKRTNPLCLTKRASLAFRKNNLKWIEIKYDIHIQLQSASAHCHIPIRTINISSIRIIRFFQIAYPENSNNLLHIKVSWCYKNRKEEKFSSTFVWGWHIIFWIPFSMHFLLIFFFLYICIYSSGHFWTDDTINAESQ